MIAVLHERGGQVARVVRVVASPTFPHARSGHLTRDPGSSRYRGWVTIPKNVGDHSG
ncbi:MAG TPA: hypothetical protein VHW64_09855 [Nocardioides sp.]|uniref:hypothetical protein n=1 Tax=Nocardioides sp. TaxID=35761 RepID=UPI002E3252D7|nr:hypothetical protein [Nocardioides sp.]HEX3930999.1 hypothetical protein [Nocardioides sp.]